MGYKKRKLWKKILKRNKYNTTWKTEQCNHGIWILHTDWLDVLIFTDELPKKIHESTKLNSCTPGCSTHIRWEPFCRQDKKNINEFLWSFNLLLSLGPLYLLYLNFQIHNWPIWLSQVTINIVSGDNIDPVAFLNKKDSFYVLSTNIYIYEALFPAPIIFQGDWFRGTVFDLKQILLQRPKHKSETFQKKTDTRQKVVEN